jgi:hypothetical protein
MKWKFPGSLAGVAMLVASAAATSQQPSNVPPATAAPQLPPPAGYPPPGGAPNYPPPATNGVPVQPAGGYTQAPAQGNYPAQPPQGYAPAGSYSPPAAPASQQPAPAGTYMQQPAANAAAAGAGYATGAAAQTPGAAADAAATPYHVHRDVHNGHDHVYPDRGSVVRELPHAAPQINYAGVSYRFYEGVWYEPRGPVFIVVAPPIGLLVSSLPAFATELTVGGQAFFYANEIYYLPRPDLAGYEVINDPTQVPPAAAPVAAPAPATATAAPMAAAVAATTVAAPVAAAAATPAQLPASVRVYAYPRNGQSAEQQTRDQYDCYRFAASQTGMDPMRGAAGPASARDLDFQRAESACLDGRGYTVH